MANDQGYSRRNILKWGGAAASIMVAGSLLPNFGISTALAADLGSGDIGVLNYAYALEQLEAAFYTQAVEDALSRHHQGRARDADRHPRP